MIELPVGVVLMEERILEAVDFRRAMRKVDSELSNNWWFNVWGLDKLSG